MNDSVVMRRTKTTRGAKPAAIILLLLICVLFAFVRIDIDRTTGTGPEEASAVVHFIEDYGRHLNTIVPLALVIANRDLIGAKQIAVIALSGTVLTHGAKRALNDVHIGDTRLGQRPSGPTSNHNFPSGHSSLASAGAWFGMRRFGWKWGILLIPIMFFTMYARVMLDAHTVSAVLCGGIVGVLSALPFATIFRSSERSGQGWGAAIGHCFAASPLDATVAIRSGLGMIWLMFALATLSL